MVTALVNEFLVTKCPVQTNYNWLVVLIAVTTHGLFENVSPQLATELLFAFLNAANVDTTSVDGGSCLDLLALTKIHRIVVCLANHGALSREPRASAACARVGIRNAAYV